jgi:hypothetical protein
MGVLFKNPFALLFNHAGSNLYFAYFWTFTYLNRVLKKTWNFYRRSFSSNEVVSVRRRGERPPEGQDRAHQAAQLPGRIVWPNFALKRRLLASFL